MTRYTGNHCPVCEQAFTDEDDIVVCPDCGTPYHRACWQKVGVCMHKSEHVAGFEWQPEVGPDADKAAHEATCPNCGTHNTPGAVRCAHCGCPLPKAPDPITAKADDEKSVPIYARDPTAVTNSRTAPGPPMNTAVPTPTMLPVPMVAASAVVSAPNWVMSPSALEGSSLVTDSLMPVPILR